MVGDVDGSSEAGRGSLLLRLLVVVSDVVGIVSADVGVIVTSVYVSGVIVVPELDDVVSVVECISILLVDFGIVYVKVVGIDVVF